MPTRNTPISETVRVVREQTFQLTHHRKDFRDAVAKLIIMAEQLHSSRFTGSLVINWGQGSITNVTSTDSKKIDPS